MISSKILRIVTGICIPFFIVFVIAIAPGNAAGASATDGEVISSSGSTSFHTDIAPEQSLQSLDVVQNSTQEKGYSSEAPSEAGEKPNPVILQSTSDG